MKYYQLIILAMSCVLAQFCSNDIAEQGKEAFLQKNYNDAIKFLTSPEIEEEGSTNQINEIIVLSYMYRGQELYEKTKNVKSFSGNYNSCLKYLPDSVSNDFKVQYSMLLANLAEAYAKAKADNDFEQDKFNKSSIAIVNLAINYDSTNIIAHELHEKFKEQNFKALLKKANLLYTKAKKLDDADLYFAAEACINDAAEYDPNNTDVKNLRKQIRRSTLGILNYSDGVALAITDRIYDKGKMVMLLSVKNYKCNPVTITPDKIQLVDFNGKGYPVDKEEMKVRKIFGQNIFESKKLDANNPYANGIITFDLDKTTPISYIVVKDNGDEITRKYFQ